MKKYLLITAVFLVSGTVAAQKSEFTIHGKLTDVSGDAQKVIIHDVMGENAPKDTVAINNGSFNAKGLTSNQQEVRILTVVDGSYNKLFSDVIIVEKGTLNLMIGKSLSFKNSPENDKYQDLNKRQDSILTKASEVDARAKKLYVEGQMSPEKAIEMESEMKVFRDQFSDLVFNYVKKNAKNQVGEFGFLTYAEFLNIPQSKELYSLFRPGFQGFEYTKMIMEQHVWGREGLVEGEPFKDIELATPLGKKENVGNYIGKGKVVLVDFWASWCGPCRKEMPFVASLYNQYKDSGFEVIGISLDENKTAWQSAIKAMNMTWPQLSDLGGWDGKTAKHYNISRIPQNYLLGKDGKIVAHDLHGQELFKKLVELLGEP